MAIIWGGITRPDESGGLTISTKTTNAATKTLVVFSNLSFVWLS